MGRYGRVAGSLEGRLEDHPIGRSGDSRRDSGLTVIAVSTHRPSRAVRKSSVLTLVLGVVLVGVYFALKTFNVVGQPTDIGGGLILVAGYLVTAVGAVLIGRDLLRHRSSRR
jgi:hypothetical protein